MRQPPLKDYALIGDGRTAALISRAGAIDWLCWPAFDSPPLFGALLDPERGGTFRFGPAGEFDRARARRRYLDGTAVVETDFILDGGALRLTDLMPALSEEDKRGRFVPDHELIRRLECTRGEVDVELLCSPRPDLGRAPAEVRARGALGVRFGWGGQQVMLRADAPLSVLGQDVVLRARLSAGQSISLSLSYAHEAPAVLPPFGVREKEAIARTLAWWRGWTGGLRYDGPYRDAVERSAITLKLLQFAPSGAIVAAPTTSLPERIGADLNWDYRFCWLRDASLTARALYGLGFFDEADAWVSWVLHATRLTRPKLAILYDVWGRPPPRERVREELCGYRGSRPVRLGNAAAGQLQLDVYGEVIDAAARFTRSGGALDRETSSLLFSLGRYVCENWRAPDEGIWEPRSGRSHHTHSLALSWAALDRLIDLCGASALRRPLPRRFFVEREQIANLIETRAFHPGLGAYAGVLDSDVLDASVLLLPYHGVVQAASPRMRSTLACLRARLGAGRGLLYRYLAGDQPVEGAFAICSFWAVECMALGATGLDEARATFEELLTFASELGLYGEEIDPASGDALGNFPQAFTHVGLISAALALEERAARDRACTPRLTEPPAAEVEAAPTADRAPPPAD